MNIRKILSYLILLGLIFQNFAFMQVFAATPTTRTTISIKKTGSEPFDDKTWDGSDGTTAGFDESENNNVVRLQDSITYQVELSANDADIDNLIARVFLDKKQAWINIPTGCKTSGVTPISSISADKRVLTCNTGFATEGTNKIIFPTSRVIPVSDDGTEVVLNDHTVSATVSVQGDGSNISSDTSDEVTVTANFRVDTIKELKSTSVDADGNSLYIAQYAKGENGEDGSLVEYIIRTEYLKGSMIANSSNEVGGDFESDFILYDYYTDNNDNNNGGDKSTQAKLYNWNGLIPACELIGNYGPNASITCTNTNLPKDKTGPSYTPDGLKDPEIKIELHNIDVRDLDKDGILLKFSINIWNSKEDDIWTHQDCVGTTCEVMTVNKIDDFNPVSTEDASGNNLDNYNSDGEPINNNQKAYQLTYRSPGSWAPYMGFYGWHSSDRPSEQSAALGDSINFYNIIFDYRKIDGAKGQFCTKVDKSQFEYNGLTDHKVNMGNARFTSNKDSNPNTLIWGGQTPHTDNFDITEGASTILYSNKSLTTLSELHDQTCNDDLNGDGKYVIDGINQATGNADGPSDWYTNAASIGGLKEVSLFRYENIYNKDYADITDPGHTRYAFGVNHSLKIKDTATGYGTHKYLPVFTTARRDDGAGNFTSWYTDPSSIDPEDASFSYSANYADRTILVPSSYSIEKYTEPRGLKVVRGGDTIDFIIEPKLVGLWSSDKNTSDISDVLPSGTDYVIDSEMFSTDGGNTWLNRDDYIASNPDITITSAKNTNSSNLVWNFGSVEAGEQLPLIKYSVKVDPNLVNGTFTNTATIEGPMGADDDGDGNSDPKTSSYQLTILPEYGFDISKYNRKDIYSTNTPFIFDLNYKNLGGESYSNGEFIDILPFNGDGAGNISGLASNRLPASKFNGTYKVSKLIGTNSEVFYATTDIATSVQNDPCHEANQAVGYVPVSGDLCYTAYVNNGNKFKGGSATGTATTNWVQCTSLDPVICGGFDSKDITAIKFTVASVPSSGGKIVSVELTPEGNLGGTPNIDNLLNVTAASTGDIYTNTFSGRVPEISLLVISNDASVTMVSGSIGDRVYLDNDNSGTENDGDIGAENVKLSIFDSNGNPVYTDPVTKAVVSSTYPGAIIYTTTTDTNGNYKFENLPSGEYTVEIDATTLPEHVLQTYDPDSIKDGKTTHTLVEILDNNGDLVNLEDNTEKDFGYLLLSSIGDTVWEDMNANGIQDEGESGFEGIVVNLLDSNGDIFKTTSTDENGKYLFEDLIFGEYSVEIILPPKTDFSDKEQSLNINTDSNINITTGKTDVIDLLLDEDKTDIDAGVYKFATVEGTVFHDKGELGKQYTGDLRLGNVKVDLLDGKGNIIKTTYTDSNGKYIFEDLIPGEFFIRVEKPKSFNKISPKNSIDDTTKDYDINNEGLTSKIILVSGEYKKNIDAGFYISHSGKTKHMDVCDETGGDFSGDYYDGKCGEATEQETTINAVNDQKNTKINTSITINLLNNDLNPDSDSKIITNINGINVIPGDGKEIDVEGGKVILLKNGRIKFIPNIDFVGEVKFPYSITDDEGDIDTAFVIITITTKEKSEEEKILKLKRTFSEFKLEYENILEKEKLLKKLLKEEKIEEKTFVLPKILPKTGTPISKRVKEIKNYKVDTTLPNSDIFKLAGSTNTDLNFWKKILPKVDQNRDEYVVIPSNGLVIPVNKIPENTTDFNTMISGKEIHVNNYLKTGVMEYPNTGKLGESGNKVIFGHSSYWKNDDGRYKTHFGKIIEMNTGEQVWVYKKINGEFKLFKYIVEKSYNTKASDVGVLLSTKESTLTLFTCTPIGGIAGRWIIKAKYVGNDSKNKRIQELQDELSGKNISSKYRKIIFDFTQKLKKIDSEKRKIIIYKTIKKIDLFLEKNKNQNNKTINILKYLRVKLLKQLFIK